MANNDLQELLQTGIQAARVGNRGIARRILEQVIDRDPQNEIAWMWLASVVETTEQRRECLQRVLAINPRNERAAQALERLGRTTPVPRSAAEARPAAPLSRAERTAALEREAISLARSRRRRGRMSPLTRTLLILIGLGMLAIGLYNLWLQTRPEDETPTPAAAVAAQPTVAPTPRLSPTPRATLRPLETPGPTWTPLATNTPTATPLPTATPIPLNTYRLLISQQSRGPLEWQIMTLLGDGSALQALPLQLSGADTTAGLELIALFDAAVSPDQQQIALSARIRRQTASGTSEFEDIFVAPIEGGELQRLTTLEAGHVEDVSWSPDGQAIAFASDYDGDWDVYVLQIGEALPTPLTINTFEDRDPVWSPVDDIIVFASDQESPRELEIFRMSGAGTDLKRLTNAINSSFAPAWSPDGARLVFISDRRQNRDLYTMNADGTGQRAVIVRDVEAEELDPAWSRDGQWLAFSSNREGAVFDIFVIRPDGTGLQRATIGAQRDSRYPCWP